MVPKPLFGWTSTNYKLNVSIDGCHGYQLTSGRFMNPYFWGKIDLFVSWIDDVTASKILQKPNSRWSLLNWRSDEVMTALTVNKIGRDWSATLMIIGASKTPVCESNMSLASLGRCSLKDEELFDKIEKIEEDTWVGIWVEL